MKKLTSLFLAIIMILGAFAVVPVSADTTKDEIINKTVRLYTNSVIWWKEKGCDTDSDYYIKTTNKKYIKVYFSPYSFDDDAAEMELEVSGKKLTSKEKPVVTVYRKDKNGKVSVLKKFRFTVKKSKKVKVKSIKVNKGELKRTSIPISVKSSYLDYYTKPVVFSYSKKGIAKVSFTSKPSTNLFSFYRGEVHGYYAKGLKYGKTKVTAKLKGTNIKLASFYVTVKKIKTSIKKKYKTVTLEYSPKGEVEKQECLLDAVLSNIHSGSKYSVSIKNKKIAEDTAHYSWSQCIEGYLGTYIRAKKLGTTTVTVYEKNGTSKIKVGSFKIKVKKANMSEVLSFYVMLVDDYGPYDKDLTYGQTYNLESVVKKLFLYDFTKDEYTISYKVESPKYLSVSGDGKVKCLTKDSVFTYAIFTIKFKDGSKFIRYTYFDLNNKD